MSRSALAVYLFKCGLRLNHFHWECTKILSDHLAQPKKKTSVLLIFNSYQPLIVDK